MRLRYSVPLTVIAVMFVITVFIGSSYSLWQYNGSQTTANVIKTGCFELEFQEQSGNISLTNSYPIADEKGLRSTPYQFTITNTCDIDASYTVYLNTLNTTSNSSKKLEDKYIKYAISPTNGSSVTAQSLVSSATKNTTDKKNIQLAQGETLSESYQIGTGTLKGKTDKEAGQSVTYTLRLWIDSTATTAINGQTFEASISTVAYAKNS